MHSSKFHLIRYELILSIYGPSYFLAFLSFLLSLEILFDLFP